MLWDSAVIVEFYNLKNVLLGLIFFFYFPLWGSATVHHFYSDLFKSSPDPCTSLSQVELLIVFILNIPFQASFAELERDVAPALNITY